MESVYFSSADVAKMLGVEVATVRKWCAAGRLKASKPTGRDYFIKKTDFEEFMEGRKQ